LLIKRHAFKLVVRVILNGDGSELNIFFQGWQGIHAEGGVWANLFGLLLWPALFDGSVPGAFVHPFHTAPLDLGTDGFYAAREAAIEVRPALTKRLMCVSEVLCRKGDL
jgi:hypothetical protein